MSNPDTQTQPTVHDRVRSWFATGKGSSIEPSQALSLVLLPLLSRQNEDGALRSVARELRAEMERRLEDYIRHCELTTDVVPDAALESMNRWRLRKARTAIRLLEEFERRLDAWTRFDDAHSPHTTGERCTETTAISDEELASHNA